MTIAQQIGNLNRDLDVRSKAADFVRVAQSLAASGGSLHAAATHAKNSGFSERAVSILQKSVVSPLGLSATLSESGVISGFVDSLTHAGAFDAMLPSMIRVPMQTRVAIITAGASGSTVGENQIKKISSLTLEANTLEPAKAVAIVIVSEETAMSVSPDAFALFGNALRTAVILETDAEFLRALTAAGISTFASSGPTASGARQDIRTLLSAVSSGASSALFLITTPVIAEALCIISDPSGSTAFPNMRYNGGEIAGIPVLLSDAATAGTITLVDATGVAAASADFELDDARHASLQLNDAPDSPPSASTVPTSLWQNNLTAIRVTRYFGVERLRTSAVAQITGVNFTGNSP